MLWIVKHCICHLIASASKKCIIFIQEVIHNVCFATQNNISFCYVVCLRYCFESFKISCSGTPVARCDLFVKWTQLMCWLADLTCVSDRTGSCLSQSWEPLNLSLSKGHTKQPYWSRFQPPKKERKKRHEMKRKDRGKLLSQIPEIHPHLDANLVLFSIKNVQRGCFIQSF